MTGEGLAQIITAVGTLIAAVGGVVVSVRNGRKIEQVHESTNGIKTELVNEVRQASFAKGVKSETDKL